MVVKNDIEQGRFRVIKISKEALWEFIYESIIDKQEDYFDIKDITKIISHFDINFETGEFICLLKGFDETPDSFGLPEGIDLQLLLKNMEDTTSSLFQSERYKEYSYDELRSIQLKAPDSTKQNTI